MKWFGDYRESFNILPIVVGERGEGLHLLDGLWNWPLLNAVDLRGIWLYARPVDNMTQKLNLLPE